MPVELILPGCDPVCKLLSCLEDLMPNWAKSNFGKCDGDISVDLSIARTERSNRDDCIRRKEFAMSAILHVHIEVNNCKFEKCTAGYVEQYIRGLLEFSDVCCLDCPPYYIDTDIHTSRKENNKNVERRVMRYRLEYNQKIEKVEPNV